MIILPAIDLKDKTCVRLYKGDFATAHKVAENAVDTAKKFEQAGAMWLHMVDLDGAKNAKPYNDDVIFDVKNNTNLHIEVGGGIRDMKTVEYYLENGISRVILGSAALNSPEFVKEAVKKYSSVKYRAAKLYPHDIGKYIECKTPCIEEMYKLCGN